MSLLRQQPRPLSRDVGTLRDTRLFIIACDDTYAPKQYFELFRLPRVQVHVVPTTDGTCDARHVLDRLLPVEHEEDDERWLLLDVDHYARGHHLATLTQAIGAARQNGVNVALNKPCFHLWLLLHHQDEASVSDLTCAADVDQRLRGLLGGFNKTRLRAEHYPAESVVEACARAERLDASVAGGDIPQANTARVYRIWKAIAAKALASQLPPELRPLIPGAI